MTTPDEPAARQPFLAELRAYFVSNVMTTVWSALLFAGGIVFLVYFFSIRFMPELNPQASITLLAAAVLTAGFLLFGFMVWLFAPFLLWKILMPTHSYERLQVLWYKDGQLKLLRIMLWVLLPFVEIAGSILFIFFTSYIAKLLSISIGWGIVSLVIIPLIHPLVVFLRWNKLSGKPPCILRWRVTIDLLWGLFLAFPGLFLSISALTVLTKDLPFSGSNVLFIPILYFLVVVYNSAMVVNMIRTPLWHHFVIALWILFYVLSISNQLTLIPNRVMNIFKFGNLPNASLVFDETGCTIVQHHGLITTSYTPDPSTHTLFNPKTCSLSSVMILSRLGNTYYLKVSRRDNTSVSFTIPGQNVLSWATVDEPKNVGTAGSSASTGF